MDFSRFCSSLLRPVHRRLIECRPNGITCSSIPTHSVNQTRQRLISSTIAGQGPTAGSQQQARAFCLFKNGRLALEETSLQRQHRCKSIVCAKWTFGNSSRAFATTTADSGSSKGQNLYRTLTFYTLTSKAIPKQDLELLRDQLLASLTRCHILGRVYLSGDGINLHVCSPVQHIQDLQQTVDDLVLSKYGKGIDGGIWNFSTEEATAKRVFRKLKVQVKKQLVADGRLGQWDLQLAEPPTYLEPEAWHKRLDLDAQGLDANGNPVSERALLVDMRNHFENEVGTFKTAFKMDCTTFRQNMDLLDELVKNRDKNKEILMVCTGGIRCSVSGRYLRQKGFTDVKMLKGGITSYGRFIKSQALPPHQHGDQQTQGDTPTKTAANTVSHFIGKNFTFDGRRGERITEDVIAHCQQCHGPHDDFSNCANPRCHLLFIQCPSCRAKWSHTCGPECKEAVEKGTGPAVQKPYDYHAQVRPDREVLAKAA